MKKSPIKDHFGHSFKSVSSMARAYGADPELVARRLNSGWDVRRALTQPVKKGSIFSQRITAPNGITYPNHKEMCKAYNVPFDRYVARINLRHWSVEDALLPSKFSGIFIRARDHKGRDYPSLAAMARAWHLPVSCLYSRLNAGWSIEKILTTPAKVSKIKYEKLKPEYDAGLD